MCSAARRACEIIDTVKRRQMRSGTWSRRLPVGAEIVPDGGVHFRVWAPLCRSVAVVLEAGIGGDPRGGGVTELRPEPGAYFAGVVPDAAAGSLYRYLLDGDGPFPDPASRFQPQGPHGPSQVVDPTAFEWHSAGRAVAPEDRVLYEMHIGTFTTEGSWSAAAAQLAALADLGVTTVELLPVADFPGRFGWGYDGVNLFAPTRLYGEPDDFRRFIDEAHGLGLGVILDVVYNHLGPDGNYLGRFADTYFTDRYETDWGLPFNFDGPGCGPVREFILSNVDYWIREFRLDGLRLDATQAIFDAHDGSAHILAQIGETARRAAAGRRVYMVCENEPQDAVQLRPVEAGGYGLDAAWNDDWHHSAIVALTGRSEAYYSDYMGSAQEFVSAAKYGFLYQGQHYAWQKQRRGTPALDIGGTAFINFLQNHDQVANSARGDRVHTLTSPGQLRAMTALLLLGPATPMLFQGQEFAASAPFLYFADHEPELANAVQRGRRQFLEQFPSMAQPMMQEEIDDPADPETFRRCRLDHAERETNAAALRLHRDLLHLRHADGTLGLRCQRVDGAVLGGSGFVLRFFGMDATGRADRLLLVNLGREMRYSPAPEPLLAPPPQHGWVMIWSSEDVKYGGLGHQPPEARDGRWQVPAQCAVVLAPQRTEDG